MPGRRGRNNVQSSKVNSDDRHHRIYNWSDEDEFNLKELGVLRNDCYDDDDRNGQQFTKTYRRRWYILLIFSALVIMQSMVWNTWAPISSSAEAVFHWTDANMALFANWGTSCFVVFVLPFAWLMNTKGLRISVILASFLVLVGTSLRCITSEPSAASWLINIGHFFNGISGPVFMAAPSQVSAVWFPEFQRTTATAIGASSATLGIAASFILGPLLVSEPELINQTYGNSSHFSNITDFSKQSREIRSLLFMEFGIVVGLFVFLVMYFPNQPPKPPSITASVSRFKFKDGFTTLIRNGQFWLICLSFGIYNGVYYGWMSIITPFLILHNFTQIEAGWLGFYSLISGQLSALILSWFLDRLDKKMKLTIILLKLIYFGMIFWMFLLWKELITFAKASMYISCLIQGACNFGSVAIYYELAIESLYPVNEAVVTAILNMMVNGVMIAFLVLQIIMSSSKTQTSRDSDWMIWCLLASVVFSLFLLCFFKESYNRLKVDKYFRKNMSAFKFEK